MRPDWIAVDWGTTNLRAWAMGPAGVLAAAVSDDGMGRLTPFEFEPALLRLIGSWLSGQAIAVLACGMVGSRQGWHEAPYRTVPCAPLHPGALVAVPVQDSRISFQIAPGLKQITPADVMRGEETQIAGALALHPGFEGVFCLPGTHSKWVRIHAGDVISFQTYLTGEMFSLLSEHSVLRHGMTGDDWDDAAFDQGVSEGRAQPERILAGLFRLRAEALLAELPAGMARARLSGLLIGAELAASKAYWLSSPVMLVGSSALTRLYARALAAQGLQPQVLGARDCTIAGLTYAAGAVLKAAE